MEKKINKGPVTPSKDGDAVWAILKENASSARTVGRSVVFTIIATSWALTYSRGELHTTLLVQCSLFLALVYVFLDVLHYVVVTTVYKYILEHYFDSVEGGYIYKKGKDASACSRRWMNVGFVWLIIMSALLLVSSVLLMIYVWDITQTPLPPCCCCK